MLSTAHFHHLRDQIQCWAGIDYFRQYLVLMALYDFFLQVLMCCGLPGLLLVALTWVPHCASSSKQEPNQQQLHLVEGLLHEAMEYPPH
jgi:hypothetical protein